MPSEETLAGPPPQTLTGPPPPVAPVPPVHLRVREGIRHRRNWLQLVKFCVVGGSGYFVNLAVFAVAVSALDLHHLLGATLAFCVAVANNFWWNRHWTFAGSGGRARFQAPRFLTVSVAAFLAQAAMLQLLVVAVGLPELVAQAVSVIAATPLNFIGNKMWSFAGGRAPA